MNGDCYPPDDACPVLPNPPRTTPDDEMWGRATDPPPAR